MSNKSDCTPTGTPTINDVLARNLRRFRAEQGLSQADVARRAGLSKQTLSTLEHGLGNPTIETLEALAAALRLPPSQLMTGWGTRVSVQRVQDATYNQGHSTTIRPLGQIYGSGNVNFEIRRLKSPTPDTVTAHTVGSMHHAYVISGSVELGPVTELYTLNTGDFIRFSADLPHAFRCLSPTATLHIVTTVPMVPNIGDEKHPTHEPH